MAKARCEYCGKVMARGGTCTEDSYFLEGGAVTRLRWGEDKRFNGSLLDGLGKNAPMECCPDCGVARGGYHHPGCLREECPLCGGQVLTCQCPYAGKEDDE